MGVKEKEGNEINVTYIKQEVTNYKCMGSTYYTNYSYNSRKHVKVVYREEELKEKYISSTICPTHNDIYDVS